MDAEKINSRSDGQSKPNSEVKVDEDTIDDHGSIYKKAEVKFME